MLYTPLGGDLHYAAYREQHRYALAPGVNYSSQVGGFSGGSSSGSSTNYSPSTNAYVSPSFMATNGVNYSTSTNFGGASNYGGGGLTLQNKTITSGGGASGSGMMALGGGRKSSNGVSNTFSGGGTMGGSLFNTTTLADGGVMQRGTEDEEDDPLDPGNEPGGGALGMPLNNELGILILLASLFAIYKWLIIAKK